MQELEADRSSDPGEETWGTRQSVEEEERVIDRYVIDTHPDVVQQDDEIPVEEEPVVAQYASSPISPRQPQPEEVEEVSPHDSWSAPEEEPVLTQYASSHVSHSQPAPEEAEESSPHPWNAPEEDDDVLEREFTAALRDDDPVGADHFSAELLSRSLEQHIAG